MSPQPPRIVVWLLAWCGASDALIGDLHEIFAAHPSRWWCWQQAAWAVRAAARRYIVGNKAAASRNFIGVPATVLLMMYAGGCGATPDVGAAIRIEDFRSGWAETAPVDGQRKVAPAVSLSVKNVSDESLRVLQLNAVFRRGDERQEWGNAFRIVSRSEGLAPGASTAELWLVSQRGYVGGDEAPNLLVHSQFVDARVDLFGKYGSTPWVKLGEYPITRTLMTP